MKILCTMALNHELVLKDDARALEIYQKIADSSTNKASAQFFTGVQGVARVSSRHGDYQSALDVLQRVEIDKVAGGWRAALRLTYGQTLEQAGRIRESTQAYQKVLDDENASKADSYVARQALLRLSSDE